MSYTFKFVVVFVCVLRGGGGGGGEERGVPYLALCGLFWWDCALCVYRISYSS